MPAAAPWPGPFPAQKDPPGSSPPSSPRMHDTSHNSEPVPAAQQPCLAVGGAQLWLADCVDWLASAEPCSFHGVVTDPPYGLAEFDAAQIGKMRAGSGGGVAGPADARRFPPFAGAEIHDTHRPRPRTSHRVLSTLG